MEFLCPTVTYTLNPDQQEIHQVIISYYRGSNGRHLFSVKLDHKEPDSECYQLFRMDHVLNGSSIKLVHGDRPWNNQDSDDPRWMPYKEVIEPIFKRYVKDHVPKVQHLVETFKVPVIEDSAHEENEETYAYPQTAEDILDRVTKEINQWVDEAMKRQDFGNGHPYIYASYDLDMEMDERTKLTDTLKPYGVQVDFMCDDLHIRMKNRPNLSLKDTAIGQAVTKYWDAWEQAHPQFEPAEDIVRLTMDVLNIIAEQKVDQIIEEMEDEICLVSKPWYEFECYGNTEEVEGLLQPRLEPYGVSATRLSRNLIYIHVEERPKDEVKDTKIGCAVTRYMDRYDLAQVNLKLAQSKLEG